MVDVLGDQAREGGVDALAGLCGLVLVAAQGRDAGGLLAVAQHEGRLGALGCVAREQERTRTCRNVDLEFLVLHLETSELRQGEGTAAREGAAAGAETDRATRHAGGSVLVLETDLVIEGVGERAWRWWQGNSECRLVHRHKICGLGKRTHGSQQNNN